MLSLSVLSVCVESKCVESKRVESECVESKCAESKCAEGLGLVSVLTSSSGPLCLWRLLPAAQTCW